MAGLLDFFGPQGGGLLSMNPENEFSKGINSWAMNPGVQMGLALMMARPGRADEAVGGAMQNIAMQQAFQAQRADRKAADERQAREDAYRRQQDALGQKNWQLEHDLRMKKADEDDIIGSAETGYYSKRALLEAQRRAAGGAGPTQVAQAGAAPTVAPSMPGTVPTPPAAAGGLKPLVPPASRASTLTREQEKEYAARIRRYNESADSARGMLSDVAHMRGLRQGVGYEGGWFPDARTSIGQALDLPGGFMGLPSGKEAGNAAALGSKATDLQLGFSEKTKGAITDREQAMFASATPGMKMADKGAAIVLDGQEAVANRVVERSKFYQEYIKRNGSLAGADENWDSYIRANPIVDMKNGEMSINKGNVSNWKDYVGGDPGKTPAQEAPKAAATSDALIAARDAIKQGAPKEAVIKRLIDNGINPAGL